MSDQTDTTPVQLAASTPREIAATGQVVEPGETVDVPPDLAEQLLEQPDVWTKPTKTSKRSKTTTKAEEADR